MLARTILFFVCAFLFHSPGYADPANVLVGDFTFTRPETWKWESSGKSNVLSRFIIPDGAGIPTGADVRFYLLQMNATVTAALWKSYFPQAKESDCSEEKKKIGNHDLTYVSLNGTQIYPGSKPKPGCAVFGAIIPSGKDFVHIRLVGPKSEVEAARPRFKKMVEDALRDKDTE
ncbi:MAG: hypothetical protein JWM68_2752 [Verrucomicrobiales bacterium]|nr:hypothetical protein [Verrucomicrobiales bacterium]